ncbi:MAG: GNAT family N-acetyltransferase [Singulisphaera sp.]
MVRRGGPADAEGQAPPSAPASGSSLEFLASDSPSEELISEVSGLAPTNPFYTPAYFRARSARGVLPFVFALKRGGELVAGCPAYMREGRWSRTLEVESLPNLPPGDCTFWDGLDRFCRARRVAFLEVDTFASETAGIPSRWAELERRRRTEHLLDLCDPDGLEGVSSQHIRNFRRARKAGLEVRSSTSVEALRAHTGLMAASMERRRDRGEFVPEVGQYLLGQMEPLLRTGAAELFQAWQGDRLLSSLLVLLSQRGGYYQSAGTTREGMAIGASPFLVHEVACRLRLLGIERFNLGGADATETGLHRFKAGFGGREVTLERARFVLGNPLARKLRMLLERLRNRVEQH